MGAKQYTHTFSNVTYTAFMCEIDAKSSIQFQLNQTIITVRVTASFRKDLVFLKVLEMVVKEAFVIIF